MLGGDDEEEEKDPLEYLEEFDPSRGVKFHHHLLAGSFAGLAEHGLIFPLDTMKTMSQCSGACGVRRKNTDVYCTRAARALLQDVLASKGWRRLWRGVGAITVACVPAHAVYFGSFEAVRQRGENSPMLNGLAGSIAAVGHDIVMTPADVAKQRLQLGYHAGLVDCFRHIFKDGGGFATLYRSLPTTLFMNAPYGAVSVAVNEWIKAKWRTGHQDLPVHYLLFSGGIAGAVASVFTTPLDVVKTRLQTQGLPANLSPLRQGQASRLASPGAAGSVTPPPSSNKKQQRGGGPQQSQRRGFSSLFFLNKRRQLKKKRALLRQRGAAMLSTVGSLKYRGFADAALAVWREEGPRGFLRGAPVRALAQAPSVAIVWTTYELFVKLIARQTNNSSHEN